MIFKKLYNKEIKFLFIWLIAILILTSTVIFTAFRKNTSKFETMLQSRNYDTIYSYIEKPDFSKEMFKKYMNYNFGDKISIISRNKKSESIDYVLKGINRDIAVNLVKKNDKYVWLFDDYLYSWHIKLPKSAKLYIEGERIDNNDGEIIINRLPFSIYNVKTFFVNIETYNENILAGQNLDIKFKLPEEAAGRCNEIIKNYLALEESAVNNKNIDGMNTDFLDLKSGIFKEITDEIEWLKKQDYKLTKKLISEKIVNSEISDDDIICVDVLEKWDVTIVYDKNTSHETQDNIRKYFIKSGQKYIISQIQTKSN
jgi:hypothetical protein